MSDMKCPILVQDVSGQLCYEALKFEREMHKVVGHSQLMEVLVALIPSSRTTEFLQGEFQNPVASTTFRIQHVKKRELREMKRPQVTSFFNRG